MEYDIERIGKLIKDIERYQKELDDFNITSIKDLEDPKNFHAASMVVFAILNRLIDLGNDILLAEKVGAPDSYQDIMPLLAKANVINREQAPVLNELVKKRNMLAHFYEEINKKELLKTIHQIPQVSKFIQTIAKRIKI